MATTEQLPPEDQQTAVDSIEAARERAEESAEEGQQIVYENGFTWKVFIGALFVGAIMLPGAIYLGLVAGQSLGGAAQWVTIVLFSEVARRSFLPLKRQEIYCLYYMAGALAATGFGQLPGISGGPFGQFIALQYLINSPAMAPVAPHLPGWIAPHRGSAAYIHRTFIDSAWLIPICILLFNQIFDRMKWMGLGYMLFRVTSDVERLPFPLAPVAASGATALAEAATKEESWRWRVFSIGSIIGLVFGFFYLAIPIFTGIALSTPLTLLPIPFIDLTPSTEHILPTSLIGYNPDLGAVLVGFVLPYQIVLGSFISSIVCQAINPILYYHGFFPDFIKGSPAIQAQISLSMDFWLSFGVGTQLAVAAIGLVAVGKALLFGGSRMKTVKRASLASLNKQRGDFPWWAAIGVWLVATTGYIILNHHFLVPLFPLPIIIFYGLVWTPLNSYISARMMGLTGSPVTFPYLNQAVVLSSHYHRPDIWFAPLPLNDYGPQAQKFREIELTGTKFSSIVKLEIFMLPVILAASFIYWGFLWHTTDIPSSQFPYAQKFWPINAVQTAMFSQINAVGHGPSSWVMRAIKRPVIGVGFGVGIALYCIIALFKAPLLFYGVVGGIGQFPHFTIPTFVGALLGRFYFAKRFGFERWNLYAPVLLAGFACGTGLIGMAAIAIALISKTVNYLPF